MFQKIFFIVALASLLSSAAPHLTREILQPDPHAEQQTTENERLKENLIELFLETPQQVIKNLASLHNTNPDPKVPDVLEAINNGLGSRIFVIDDDVVRINPDAFETVVLTGARRVAKVVYPKSYFDQVVFAGMLQQKIKSVFREARPVIIEQKIPVRAFESALTRSKHFPVKRGVQTRSLMSDMLSTVQLSLCNTVVGTVYRAVNTTLNRYLTFLQNINVTIGERNVLTTLVYTGVNIAINLLQDFIAWVDAVTKEFSGSACASLLNPSQPSTGPTPVSSLSRKRREVEGETALAAPSYREAAAGRGLFDGIWQLIRSLISPVINAISTSLVGTYVKQLHAYVETLINNSAQDVYDFIHRVFST